MKRSGGWAHQTRRSDAAGIVSPAPPAATPRIPGAIDGGQAPATVMPSTSSEPVILLPRTTVSVPTATMPREHLPEVAGDRDFLDRVADLPALHPEAAGAARVVAGDVVDALADQFGHQQPGAQPAQHDLEVVFLVGAAGPQASGCRSRPRCRLTSCRACAPSRSRGSNLPGGRPSPRGDACPRTPSSSNGLEPGPRGRYGSSSIVMWGANTGLPSASTRKDDLRYSAPPLAACTKLPSRPHASGASNSTGTLARRQLARAEPRQRPARRIVADRLRRRQVGVHPFGGVPVVALHAAWRPARSATPRSSGASTDSRPGSRGVLASTK